MKKRNSQKIDGNIHFYAITILSLLFFAQCSKNNPTPQQTNGDVFETIWSDFDNTYPYFIHKKIDWDSVYEVFKPQITNDLNQEELFELIGEMTLVLHDVHVSLSSSYGIIHYSKKENYPLNPSMYASKYISKNHLVLQKVEFSDIANSNYSYLYIRSFQSSPAGEINEAVSVLDTLQNRDGLIIDIRNNSGGNELIGRAFAGRFIDSDIHYKNTRIRNGDEWDNFTSWNQSILPKTKRVDFHKKIVLLTNRSVYSSSELFVLMMKTYPNLEIVGDTTGGGSANPVQKNLSNGWKYYISTWQAADLNYKLIEDNGIAPDHYVLMTEESINDQRDLILEKAIEILDIP